MNTEDGRGLRQPALVNEAPTGLRPSGFDPARKPIRVQLSRQKGWRMPPNTVKVDRTTRWGNPYLIERQSGQIWEPEQGTWRINLYSVRLLGGPYWYQANLTRAEATARACIEFATNVAPSMDLAKLRGKNLACWCPLDQPCHADVLLSLANRDSDGPRMAETPQAAWGEAGPARAAESGIAQIDQVEQP